MSRKSRCATGGASLVSTSAPGSSTCAGGASAAGSCARAAGAVASTATRKSGYSARLPTRLRVVIARHRSLATAGLEGLGPLVLHERDGRAERQQGEAQPHPVDERVEHDLEVHELGA